MTALLSLTLSAALAQEVRCDPLISFFSFVSSITLARVAGRTEKRFLIKIEPM